MNVSLLSARVQSGVREAEEEPVHERFFQPHFLQAPGDMLAHEGKLCRLDCKVRTRPGGVGHGADLITLI